MKTSDVRAGMRIQVWTVFFGTQPEPFDAEVIDVMPDFRTGQEVVFFRALDPRVMHSGIVAGMSGSPAYIDGKLLGALAYGFGFNKDAIGGITPIESMLEVDRLPYRPEVLGQRLPSSQQPRWIEAALGLDRPAVVGTLTAREAVDPSAQLTPLGAAVQSTGLRPQANAWLAQALGHPLVPGAGTMGSTQRGSQKAGELALKPVAKKKWRPGDAITVVYMAGDNAAGANGTVSWVGGKNGERLLAFGHPMNLRGPVQLPIADARVHVIIPSIQKAFKISSPMSIQGTMVQDRQPAIAARTDIEAPLIPVRTEVIGPDGAWKGRNYHNHVAVDRYATPSLVLTPLLDGLEEAASDLTEVMVQLHFKLDITTSKGPRSLDWKEEVFFPTGVERRAIAESRAYMILSALLDNHYEVGQVRQVYQHAQVLYGAPIEMIERVRLASDEVRAGSIARFDVETRTLRGPTKSETIELRIPEDAADQTIVVHFCGGEDVRPYRPVANNLDDLIDTLLVHYPERSLVASIYLPDEGLASRHGLLDSLPGSVLESLNPAGSTSAALRFKRSARLVLPRPVFVAGEHRLELEILPALTRTP